MTDDKTRKAELVEEVLSKFHERLDSYDVKITSYKARLGLGPDIGVTWKSNGRQYGLVVLTIDGIESVPTGKITHIGLIHSDNPSEDIEKGIDEVEELILNSRKIKAGVGE